MKTQVIIAAAGMGVRLKGKIPKTLVKVGDKPLVAFCLKAFEKSSLVKSIILVGAPHHLDAYRKIVKALKLKKVVKIVPGGKTRSESVAHGLDALDKDTQLVAIHDGARPFIRLNVIKKAIEIAEKDAAAIVAVPVKSTIKQVDPISMTVEETLERSKIWEIQTPQVFQRDLLLKAHRDHVDPDVTDDAALVERLGVKVKIVRGDYDNIKITTPEDLVLAKALISNMKKI